MGEHRKFIRIPEKTQVSYRIVPTTVLEQCAVSDISQKGIRFITYHFIPKNSHLKIRIVFGNTGIAIEAMVVLVWIKEMPYSGTYEAGVRFIDIPSTAEENLMDYIKSDTSRYS